MATLMDLEHLDVAVIGAGVIGLAVARALAHAGCEVMVLEGESAIGVHTSSRNSEVIHAGIYYPTGSKKARLCVAGRQALYDYCERHDVGHKRIGKIIVAVHDEEIGALERIKAQAEANGVSDMKWLDAADVRALEPAVAAVRGLLSPSTGIVDSHGLMSAFRRDAENAGAQVVVATSVVSGKVHDRGIVLSTGGPDPTTVLCRAVVNSAGLWAQEVARKIEGVPPGSIPGTWFAKGHYFVLAGKSPFNRLIYPVPVAGGLGVHVTMDLAGQARFGPDVSWVQSIDYGFDEKRATSFYPAIRTYYPHLADGALEPGYTGIRPKLGAAGTPAQDFLIQGPAEHEVAGLVNLYGIESPGLTAALAIADEVKALVLG